MGVVLARAAGPGAAAEFFEMRVRPVLVKNCYACHTSARMGGLQLDSREHLLAGGKDGSVVTPGDPEKSVLIQAVRRTHERFKMPPQGPLSDEEIANLTAWVKAGAIWPDAGPTAPAVKNAEYAITPEQRAFWSFQPVRKPAAPAVQHQDWPRNDIDRFILAKLEEKQLTPVRFANKRALIRRATFDLIGLPPTPHEVDEFLSDSSPDAFSKIVDRLLASPHYGERWGRYWLDLARYADGQLGAAKDTPFPNAFRYRDWVVQALNSDMPYDLFVKAQIAGDRLPDNRKLLPALGFYALGPDDDDRVEVTGQVFLGLTVGCARCHDHKYDPIPTKDFYSLLGVFRSSEKQEAPLAPEAQVQAYKKAKQEIDDLKDELKDFLDKQSTELGQLIARKTSRYLMAAWEVLSGAEADDCAVAAREHLNDTVLERWIRYLRKSDKDHKFLQPFDELLARHAPRAEAQKFADGFHQFGLSIFNDKKEMDDRNYVKMGGAKGVKDERTRQYTNLESLPIEKYYLWRDMASEPYKKDFLDFKGGVYFFGPKQISGYLAPEWREYRETMQTRLARLEKEMPPQYPFLDTITDTKKPNDIQVQIRGDANNLGEVAPRRFLAILSNGERVLFHDGSGRLQLAEAIASASNPLFARVMVNRVWQHHFGHGIVRTAGNFGQLGERPTHPELLDYLAAEFATRMVAQVAAPRDSAFGHLAVEHGL
jgi:mono/diheme cytochrome c family protein